MSLESGRRVVFDSVRMGQTSTRTFKVWNKMKCEVKFTIQPCLESLRDVSVTLHASTPYEVKLEPKESYEFKFIFAPKGRVRAFTCPVVAECMGRSIPLVSLAGACLGLEVKLDTTQLSFGPVVRGSQLTRRILV